jgi:hypothetical protein
MTKKLIALAAGTLAAASLHAGLPTGTHYPIGAEGLKGSDLPPPGFYLRDYNYFYYANRVDGMPQKFENIDIFAYVQAPRLVWITPWKVLGANYGCDVIIPFAYQNITGDLGSAGQFNLADIYACPMVLSWHLKRFDFSAAYGVWMPSGNFDASTPLRMLTSPGKGYWSHMLTLGGVWYADPEKTWALSLLNRYEVSTEQDQTQITPGNMYSLEWGVSKTVAKGVDLGLVGYYQQETTEDSGGKDPAQALSHVVGVGPEVSVFWEKPGLISTLRYVYEADAKDRPQGHAVTLTLTKRF